MLLYREAVSLPALAFWRDLGREWASTEATAADLAYVRSLSERIRTLRAQPKQAEVIAAFQRVWGEGFSDPAVAIPWDGMNDRMPPAALVAFVEGAGDTRIEGHASR